MTNTEDLTPPDIDELNQTKVGYYGEMGPGNNVRIKFLQTALEAGELPKIKLIENIPGSERWEVRDLFQRDVDHDRAGGPLLDYLQNQDQAKFFNPLTLVLLPMDKSHTVYSKLRVPVTGNEDDFLKHESPGLFQFMEHSKNAAYSRIKYNDKKVNLVAIDGQHRLAALQRWWEDPQKKEELEGWTIPVVILGMFLDNEAPLEEDTPNLLDVVRGTFVTINTQAEPINEARKILLDDASINSLCIQELVQASHENDLITDMNERDDNQIPLIALNWRGAPTNVNTPDNFVALKSTTEILFLFENFLFGQDGSDEQNRVLALEDLNLQAETHGHITHKQDIENIRELFRDKFFPSISYLLRHFIPYQEYTTEIRNMEREATEDGGDIARHAWDRIRYGGHHGTTRGIQQDIANFYDDAIAKLANRRKSFQPLIRKRIGLRGVFAAYAIIKKVLDENGEEDWKEYSEWFVEALNRVYDDGWFRTNDSESNQQTLHPDQLYFLTHLAYESHGPVGNDMMKAGPVELGLGSLLVLLILKASDTEKYEVTHEDLWHDMSRNMKGRLEKGYTKIHKARLKEEMLSDAEKKRRANQGGTEDAKNHLEKLHDYLNA